MGACVSKHPPALTIAISDKNLPAAEHAGSNEYIALQPEAENSASNKDDVRPQKLADQKQAMTGKVASEWSRWAGRGEQQLNDDATATATAVDSALLLLPVGNEIPSSNNNNKDDEAQHFLAYLRLLQHQQQQTNQKQEQPQQQQRLQRTSAACQHPQQAELRTVANGAAAGLHIATAKKHKTSSKSKNSQAPTKLTGKFKNCFVDADLPNSASSWQQSAAVNELQLFKNSEGQAESKKNAKKQNAGGMETKGTAMSFGFRKKLNTTPKKLRKFIEGDAKKKQDKCNNIAGKTSEDESDGGKTGAVIDTDTRARTIVDNERDNNGNDEPMPKIQFEKVGAAAFGTKSAQRFAANQGVSSEGTEGTTTPTALSGAGNRFGFRGGHVVRPASTGITPRYQRDDLSENVANNNCSVGEGTPQRGLVSNLKRRSKSAHAGRAPHSTNDCEQEGSNAANTAAPKIAQPKSITFNLKQNSTIEYQRQQFFQQPTGTAGGRAAGFGGTQQQQQQRHPNVINTGIHTNVIVRPTPRAPPATYSKFTLHTVSLPKPEFPVAISLNATTPTTPGSTYSPSPMGSNAAAGLAAGVRAKDTLAYCVTHPLTAAQSLPQQHMDSKSAKQMANNTRRGFTGSREISADSGIASMDMALDSSSSSAGRSASPKRSRSRPRNLQMVMNGRHKFEVRELDDPLSSESNSLVEPLALPQLPTENQTVPLPLSGLVRSNTVLSRESFERKNNEAAQEAEIGKPISLASAARREIQRNSSEESESLDEEKLYLDRSATEKHNKQQQFRDINTCSSKTSSPGSSIMSSWCNGGEALATKDCSSMSISSYSEDNSNQMQQQLRQEQKALDLQLELLDDDIGALNTDMQISTISSITDTTPALANTVAPKEIVEQLQELSIKTTDIEILDKVDRPRSLCNALNESKFAEMALEGSTYLLDDETSPTDSLVSSTESEEAGTKQRKHKINEELQEKDIDEISPELEEVCSPISPGTPTHASHSLSLSDIGNLIDDEIADQPALLFNTETHEGLESVASHKEKTDTPTLMESVSMRSLKTQSKARSALQQAMELSLRTPLSLRKAVMERAESLDTLSPCESICSDDLMMDFDITSSMDSIDRAVPLRSRSNTDLHKIDGTELFSELDRKGSDVMKELSSILRVHTNRKAEQESSIAHLPARATRLLNRSRLQQQQCSLSSATVDSDSSRSAQSVRRSAAGSRASCSTASIAAAKSSTLSRHHQYYQQQQQHHLQQHRDSHSSSDDLMLYDKSFRNAMIQDVLQFKKQLLRLRRILQETETLNPFENDNGQLFASCGLDSKLLDDMDLASLTSSTTDDPMQELADLRRQVVYLQSQVDDRERTIRLQRNLIEQLEAEKATSNPMAKADATKECISMATQTERTRPLAIGSEGLSRSKPEYTSYTTHFPAVCSDSTTIIQHHQQYPGNNRAANQTRRHTIISTTLTNYNQQQLAVQAAPRRASIAWEQQTAAEIAAAMPLANDTNNCSNGYKPVRITRIGEPLPMAACNGHTNSGSQQEAAWQAAQLKAVATPILHSGINNGKSRQAAVPNGVKRAYQQLPKATNLQQPQQQHIYPQTFYHHQSPANGNLKPTVTIV